MKGQKILGITAIVSTSLASLMCWGLLVDIQAMYQHRGNEFLHVAPGNWNSISTTLTSGDRWIVTYHTRDTPLMSNYLMNGSQHAVLLSTGQINGIIEFRPGDGGQFDYTALYDDTFFIIFFNNDARGAVMELSAVELPGVEDVPIVTF
ncbi:MAG: hypothetical protein JW839_09455 [Candidatus Lokiarchaeota archaeon]|nr:hypothetical protein [Candidatus Lokiarchaeota archaeon]